MMYYRMSHASFRGQLTRFLLLGRHGKLCLAGQRLVKTKHGQSSMPYAFTPLPSLSLRFKICFMGETEAILHVSMDQIFLVLWSAGTGKGETGNISAQLTCSVPPKHRVPSSATSKLVD